MSKYIDDLAAQLKGKDITHSQTNAKQRQIFLKF